MKLPRCLLVHCLGLFLLLTGPRLSAALWTDYQGDPTAWKLSPWLGFFLSESPEAGWIYHLQHGWWYALGESEDSVWFYTPDLGWVWSGRAVYPYLYQHRLGTWLSYLRDSSAPRWFYDVQAEAWFTDESRPAPAYTVPEAVDFTAPAGQPVAQALSDGTAVRLPALAASLPLTLARESSSPEPTPDGLERSGSQRTIILPAGQLTVDHLPGAALALTIPGSEAGSLPDETLVVAREGLVFQADGTTAVQTLYLPVRRDEQGRLICQDAYFAETLAALLYQRQFASARRSLALAPRAGPNEKIKYTVCTFQGELNWMRPPRLVRMVPREQNALERLPLTELTPEEQAEVNSQIVHNVIVLVHGHNEEERAGRERGTTRGPWYYSYKQDVWTPLYAVYQNETRQLAEAGVADFRPCTRFYEFIYPTYKGIFDNLDQELANALATELEPQLRTGQTFNLVLIAHSMGGLVSRAALQKLDARLQPAFQKLITWGSPHLGAELTTMRYAFDANPGYSFLYNEPRWLSNLRMVANPTSYLKEAVAEYLLRAGVRLAVNKMALDTPGTRDLRFVRIPPGQPSDLRMALDLYLTLGDEQDTELHWPLYNLPGGSWLYNANLMHLNEIDRYKMTNRYVFLYGVTSHRAEFTPQVYWPPLEMSGGITGLGASLIPWLVENPDLPYQGFTRGASDGAVSLPSMSGHGLTEFAFPLGDMDHEEYFGAPISPGAFTRFDLAEETAWTTLSYLLTDDPLEGGNELTALAMPPFTEAEVRESYLDVEDGLFFQDLGQAEECEFQLSWTWAGDDSPVNRIHPSAPIHALLGDPRQPGQPPEQVPVNLFSVDGDRLVSGKIDLRERAPGIYSVRVLLPLRDGTTYRADPFLVKKRSTAGSWHLGITYHSPDGNAFVHPTGSMDTVVAVDALGDFSFSVEIPLEGATSVFQGSGQLRGNRLSLSGTHVYQSHYEEHNELREWRDDDWVTVYQDISRDEAFSSSFTISGRLDPDFWFDSLVEVTADGLYNGSYHFVDNRDGAPVKEDRENPTGAILPSISFWPAD